MVVDLPLRARWVRRRSQREPWDGIRIPECGCLRRCTCVRVTAGASESLPDRTPPPPRLLITIVRWDDRGLVRVNRQSKYKDRC